MNPELTVSRLYIQTFACWCNIVSPSMKIIWSNKILIKSIDQTITDERTIATQIKIEIAIIKVNQ